MTADAVAEATGQAAPTPISSEEARWVDRARAGEEAAYGWLLDRYRDRAVRLAAHVLRRPDEAEDVAQEAFVRAFRGLRGFREGSSFYTWLYHIVVRICLDRRRLAWWKAELVGLLPASPAACEPADDRLLVAALMDRLSPRLRAALVLRELEGLEYEEIAQVLGIPAGTVRSRLNSARKQFDRMLREAIQETDDV